MLNQRKTEQKSYPKAISYVISFFNPVSRIAIQDSLKKAQTTLDRADYLIEKSEDLNRQVNEILSHK